MQVPLGVKKLLNSQTSSQQELLIDGTIERGDKTARVDRTEETTRAKAAQEKAERAEETRVAAGTIGITKLIKLEN